MRLSQLVSTSRSLAETSKRLEKTALIAELLRQADPAAVPVAVAFLCGSLRQGRIGVGGAALRQTSAAPAKEATLRLQDVEAAFERIAAQAGPGSAAERQRLLKSLLGRATSEEQRFLARLILGEMRQGALEGIMADAVAKACKVPARLVRRAWMLSGDLSRAAQAARQEGAAGLSRFDVQIFQPLAPMLADSADDTEAALQRLGEAAFEYKMDGARIQLHKSGGEVRIFTRGLKDVTAAVPEIAQQAVGLPVREVILDGEALALGKEGRPQPFQVTMRRFGRKLDVEAMRRKLPMAAFFFDCLFLDGESMIDAPARRRFEALDTAAPPRLVIPRLISSDADEAQRFWEQARRQGHEGVMAKSLQAAYQAGSRGKSWLKIKQAVTLDLVILAAEWGSGRRRGRLSNLHLGARDPAADRYLMLGKTFKGLTDRMLEWQTGRLLELETHRDQWTVYVRPQLVAEVAFNELQQSPRYDSGLALRFARVKQYRPEKSPQEATTIEEVRELFERMRGISRKAAKPQS